VILTCHSKFILHSSFYKANKQTNIRDYKNTVTDTRYLQKTV
jgi:hypothetical protein